MWYVHTFPKSIYYHNLIKITYNALTLFIGPIKSKTNKIITPHCGLSSSPFNQLYDYEVVAVSPVVENKAVGRRCLELHEEMHGVVGLQRGQSDEAGARAEGDGVGHYALIADNGIELAVVDVAVLAQVDVGHAVQRQALKVADEIGGHGRYEALLRHNTRLHIVELQLGVVARHQTWWRVNFKGED